MKKSRFLQWFLNQKLGKKIQYTVIFAVVIPLLVLEGLMLMTIAGNMTEKVDDLMYNQLVQVAERSNLTLEVYTNLVYQIYTNDQIIDSIIEYTEGDKKEKSRAYRIYDQLQKYGLTVSGIESISLILPDGVDITYDFGMASVVDNLWNDARDMRSITPYIAAKRTQDMAISPTEQFTRNGEEKRIFHISKRMYDFNDIQRDSIATVVLSIDEAVLNSVCNAGGTETGDAVHSMTFIMDENRNVLSYPDPFYAGIKIDENGTIEKFVRATGQLKDKEIALNKYEDSKLGWTYYNVYDKNYIFKDVKKLEWLAVIIGVILAMGSMILIRYTIQLIEHSIDGIMAGIRQIQQGNLNIKVPVESTDEMGLIADNLNTMAEKMKDLISEVEKTGEKQRKAEIKALEAQINPHFLYNTLDSINWLAIEKEEYEISEMLRNLGVILRYSVNKSNQMVTIEEMRNWLEKYVSLHQMRFNQSFSCDIHIEEETNNIRVYKLLIQPFIENAILHGFKGIESGGILRVDIGFSDDRKQLSIIIEDNGKGMPREIAEKFNRMEKEKIEDERGIGLSNAFMRIQLYYGENASWNVSSIAGVGTIIALKLPV